MLTIHAAPLVLPSAGAAPVRDGAVAVEGSTIAAVGPLREVAARHPKARVRAWPGVLIPGLVNPHGAALLEHAYHPDPREADRLGERPLTTEALDALDMTDERWGASARRGLQRMLRHGTTALTGPFARPSVRLAVARSGLAVVAHAMPTNAPAAGATSSQAPTSSQIPTSSQNPTPVLDPLADHDPRAVLAGALAPGARADLAVFDVPVAALAGGGNGTEDTPGTPGADDTPGAEADTAAAVWAALAAHGATTCVATVLAGRLVHRRRTDAPAPGRGTAPVHPAEPGR